MDGKKKIQSLKDQADDVRENLKNVAKMSNMSNDEINSAFSGPSDRAIQLCSDVIKEVPEFKKYKNFNVEEHNGILDVYALFGVFGKFLEEKILLVGEDDPVVNRIFQFINNAYNDLDDKYVRTMLSTEVLENLTISDKTKSFGKNKLEGEVANFFNQLVAQR